MLSAYLHNVLTGIRLSQDPDLILCAISLFFACLALAKASVAACRFLGWLPPKTNSPSGSNHRGHVMVITAAANLGLHL